jgi:hypothetical protein
MSDLPQSIHIYEQGPREGFQFAKGLISRRTRVAAGKMCTEDLVFMCEEMGLDTGIDLDRLIEVARLAEDIVGHPLPGSVMKGGSLRPLRERARVLEAA